MNEAAYNQTVKDNYGKIFRLSRCYFGNPDDAKDATQDVFLNVWLNKEKFRGEASIQSWIYRIAINVCLTFIRKNKRETSENKLLWDHLAHSTEILDTVSGDNVRLFRESLQNTPDGAGD